MKVVLDCDDTIGTVSLVGILNLHTLKEFDQQIKNLDFSGIQKVVLNMEQLEHIDSSGVSGIIQFHKYLQTQHVYLLIGKVSTRVARLFEQMRIFDIIPKI
jgi:anti-anti-sigma factor